MGGLVDILESSPTGYIKYKNEGEIHLSADDIVVYQLFEGAPFLHGETGDAIVDQILHDPDFMTFSKGVDRLALVVDRVLLLIAGGLAQIGYGTQFRIPDIIHQLSLAVMRLTRSCLDRSLEMCSSPTLLNSVFPVS